MTTTDLLPCGPAADGCDEPFWKALREGELRLPRCADCGSWRAPTQVLCRACRSFCTDWVAVAASGRVFTWARTHRAFMPELDADPPFTTALVELDGCGVRLLGLLRDAGEVAIGDRVVGVVEQPPGSDWRVLRWERA